MVGARKPRSVVELEDLRNRLREAEETLAAIRNGEVDSLIVSGPNGDQVFSLRGAEHPYRAFVEQMQEGAVTLTRDGTILYCNRRFADMVGVRLEKVIGGPFASFVREADHAELEVAIADAAPRKLSLPLRASDGRLIPAAFSFSPLPLDDLDAVCLVVTDLTEHEEKRELVDALEELREAQAQLQSQNGELERARREAERASEAKDQFLATLSHELRTPLTPVLMVAEALCEDGGGLPEDVREDLQLIRRNVELEARLIDDLLDLTRISRGKLEVRSDAVDLHAALNDAIGICIGDVRGKDQHLGMELCEARLPVRGDPVRIRQILWNLLRNAVKFTPPGGRITVRTETDGRTLRLSVTDTGMGIEPDMLGRLFVPFEQAGRGITQRFGGLGLGLAISRRLAELHGGTIVAASEGAGRGASFTLQLPLDVAAAAAPRTGAVDPGAAGASGGAGAVPLRILLVEDHDDTRRSIARRLGRAHAVTSASTMAEALRAVERATFDLLISDVGLPDGSGLELMRRLRQRHPAAVGICLSGFGMEQDVARSADAGFVQHLTKPVDFTRLESIIQNAARRGLHPDGNGSGAQA